MATVFITGTSTGIGFATAITLANSGHKVYAAMRNPQKSPELQNQVASGKLPVSIVTMDVDDDDSVTHGIASVLAKEGAIDVLVNNAGIASSGAVEELALEDFRKEMETNYFGTIRCIKAALPSMRERKSGCIINITSIAAKLNGCFQAGYCASKAAVEAFSESLAQEVKPYNIRIAIVEPGVIMTPIFSKGEIPVTANYPTAKRLYAFFMASLERQTSPVVVAEVVKDIIDEKSISFRNLAGPDAAPLTSFRASIKDEDWINSVVVDDETWVENMGQMGLNVKQYLDQYNVPVND